MAASKRRIVPGWQGRYYEDFQVGDVYRSAVGRTVTETDNLLFTGLTLNTNQVHFNQQYCEQTRWGRILVNSCFTLSLIVGMSVPDVSMNVMANLGWEEVTLPHPVFVGDTLYAETEVLHTRESRSHPNVGIVNVRTRGINQNGRVVIDLTRSAMVYKRDAAPGRDLFPEVAGA